MTGVPSLRPEGGGAPSGEPPVWWSPPRWWRWPRTELERVLAGCAAFLALSGGGLLLSGAAADSARADRLRTTGQPATAVITALHRERSPSVTLVFSTADGRRVTATDQRPYGTFAVGRQVPVVYVPADPDVFDIGAREDVSPGSPVLWTAGGAVTAAGAWQVVRAVRPRRRARDRPRASSR